MHERVGKPKLVDSAECIVGGEGRGGAGRGREGEGDTPAAGGRRGVVVLREAVLTAGYI